MPRMRGNLTPGEWPWRVKSSERLRPKALTRMRTSPGFGRGNGEVLDLEDLGAAGLGGSLLLSWSPCPFPLLVGVWNWSEAASLQKAFMELYRLGGRRLERCGHGYPSRRRRRQGG